MSIKKLSLSLAVGEYEHVRDLASGAVAAQGIELTVTHGPIEDLLYRTHNHAEWDVAELGFGSYISRLARGEQPYVALPVITSRLFRHSSVYVRADAGIETPQDLNGKRIGLPEWGMAVAIWARGMLAEDYGFDARSATWIQAGLHDPGRKDRMPPLPAAGVNYRQIGDRSLNEMLLAGELDAIISARAPNAMHTPGSGIKRLFSDLPQQELAYWKKTGIVPIMHFIGIRRDVYERNRWCAMELYKAFEAAKNRSLARARDVTASYFPVPLLLHAVETARKVAGDDFWPYGVAENHASFDAFLRYAYEQGVSERRVEVEEMFPPEVLTITRT